MGSGSVLEGTMSELCVETLDVEKARQPGKWMRAAALMAG